MQKSKFVVGVIGAWIMAVIYDRIKVMTGIEFEPLLYAALITMGVSLYLIFQHDECVQEEEA